MLALMQVILESVPLKQVSSSDVVTIKETKSASSGQNMGTYAFCLWLGLTKMDLTLWFKAKS
jgi:hypothetical protein